MKYIIAVLLSALFIGFAPNKTSPAHLNNSTTLTPPAAQAAENKPNNVEHSQTVEVVEPETPKAQANAEVQVATQHVSPVEAVRQRAAQKGWTGYEWESLYQLIDNESSWIVDNVNPYSGACGLYQALPCSKVDLTSVDTQSDFGLSYIQAQYGSPSNALAAWKARYPHWY